MDRNLFIRRVALDRKLPEIEKSLECVNKLIEQQVCKNLCILIIFCYSCI